MEKGNATLTNRRIEQQPLYEYKGKKLHASDFVNALGTIGVKKGDVLFVHSDIAVFGRPSLFDKDILLGGLIDSLKQATGRTGLIVMPAYTYSFCNNEVFDVDESKSAVGVLTDYFWRQPSVSRTVQPLFSVGIWGKDSEKYLDVGKDSFDDHSIFGKVHQGKGKIVFFGAPFQSLTFLHYIEQKHGVSYRYVKTFRGKVIHGNEEYEDACTYYVRRLDQNVVTDLRKFEKHLLDKGLMRKTRLGSGVLMAVESDVLFREGLELLDKDMFCFLRQKPSFSAIQ